MYQELELWYPLLRLREAGAETFVVGTGSADPYTSKLGYPVRWTWWPTRSSAADVDAVVIPGGYAPDLMRRYPAMVNLVREAFAQGKVVAAICHAGWMLASADVVEGKTGDLLLRHQGRPGQCRGDLRRRRGGPRRQSDHVAGAVRSAGFLPDDHRRRLERS